jgi:heme exporter protein D
LLKSQARLLQHLLPALWTSVTAVVDHHVKVAVAALTVVDLVEVLVTSVVVQTAVVQEVAQEMAHDQVEDQRLDPVDVQHAIAKVSFTNNPKGNLGVICLAGA